jgi:hypothetical protein
MRQHFVMKFDGDDTPPTSVNIVPPTTSGYYTNFDCQILVADNTQDDLPIDVYFGKPLSTGERVMFDDQSPPYEESVVLEGGVRFSTATISPLIEGLSDGISLYHFHSKKKVYVNNKIDIKQLIYNGHPDQLEETLIILRCDFIPRKGSNLKKTKKWITEASLSNLHNYLEVPLDIRNPKLFLDAVIVSSAADLGHLRVHVIPSHMPLADLDGKVNLGGNLMGEVFAPTNDDPRELSRTGYHEIMKVPINSSTSGVAVKSSKYINVKLNAGDRIVMTWDDVSAVGAGDISSIDVELTVEGNVIYDGRATWEKAIYRESSDLISNDVLDLIASLVGGV